MKHMNFALLVAVAVATPLLLPTVALAATKNPASTAAQSSKEPDIMGAWELYPDPPVVFGVLDPAPNGGPKLREPYASQWKARRADRAAKLKAGTPLVDASTLCLPEGMPTIMGAIYPLQILQTPGQITVLAEFLTQTRRIMLNKEIPPVEEVTQSHYGYSVGHWEGDTLVATTLGVRENVQFFEIPHSSEMKITERIRLTAPGYLENQIVIEDPKVLLEPYRFTFGYKRKDNYELTEYLCEKEDPLLKVNLDGTVQVKDDQ